MMFPGTQLWLVSLNRCKALACEHVGGFSPLALVWFLFKPSCKGNSEDVMLWAQLPPTGAFSFLGAPQMVGFPLGVLLH